MGSASLRHRGGLGLALAGALAAALTPLAAARADSPDEYRAGEYDLVRNINPPGQSGFLSAADAAQALASGGTYKAPHQDDQRGMYADLVRKAPNITARDLQTDYKDASFGIPPGQVASTETPSPGVTIIRDKQFGVPHIYGVTDANLVWGTGWVLAEDRLFLTDVLRHYGRSTLASFLGPDRSFIEMDCQQAQLTGYTEAELQSQIARLPQPYPTLAGTYVSGINAYIDATLTDPRLLPAEYAAFGLRPQHFATTDIIAIAGLVGGIFGKGGGVETRNSHFLRALYAAFGGPTKAGSPDPTRARQIFADLMENNDPAAPTSIDPPFPYENGPHSVDAAGAALTRDTQPDPLGPGGTCSVQSLPPSSSSSPLARAVAALGRTPRAMSNALLVDGAHSSTGRPIAVFGPQVGYFEPEILMEEELHSPSYNVRGVSFPGTNFIVELGHGPDYAWSATSAGTDNIDQFSERLCNPSSPDPLQNVDPNSTSYMWNGKCITMYTRTDTEVAPPSAGSRNCPSNCLPAVVTIRIQRTVHGPVLFRTTAIVGGKDVPVAIASERTTFMHEADSVAGFAAFNNPALLRNATDFLHAASRINYVFNWFYIDDRDIAYYQSGWLPIRAAAVHPDLPTWGTGQYDWAGGWAWGSARVGDLLGYDGHPHAITPPRGWITSWNNKGAPQFRASDDQWSYGQVFRSQSLDSEIAGYLSRQAGRMSLLDLDNAMESAATVDLWGTQVLPWALRIVGDDPGVAAEVALLRSWAASGGHRRDRQGSGVYEDVEAIELMDAWYPRLLHAIFDPALGTAFSSVPEQFDDVPGPVGSAYIEGWYGYAQKALQMAVGAPVAQPYQVAYCGAGCRAALIASLQAAAGDAMKADPRQTTQKDQIKFAAVGLGSVPDIAWQNRPTFQQVVDVPSHRPRSAAPVTAAVAAAAAGSASVAQLPNTAATGGAAAGLAGLIVAGFTSGVRRRRRRRAPE